MNEFVNNLVNCANNEVVLTVKSLYKMAKSYGYDTNNYSDNYVYVWLVQNKFGANIIYFKKKNDLNVSIAIAYLGEKSYEKMKDEDQVMIAVVRDDDARGNKFLAINKDLTDSVKLKRHM